MTNRASPVIWLCAATGVEARACRKAARGRFEVHQTGMGAERATHSLLRLLDQGIRPDWIISTGFAGARTRDLGVGDWILGARVENETGQQGWDLPLAPWDQWLQKSGISARPSVVRATSEVLIDAPRAGEATPDAVDMESYALASLARERGLGFQIIRLVSDTPSRPIPRAVLDFSSFGEARNAPDKFKSFARGFWSAARQPTELARFITQTLPLPARLEEGWARLYLA